ncbi:MAG TPA: LysE family transporter [Nevskia sp.]|nr:LysE family transporter [Nevskia sp.]
MCTLNPATQAVLTGFLTGAGLIIAIGPQNAHVLRLGILRRQVLPTVLLCAFVDASLIAAGLLGMGVLVRSSPLLLQVAAVGGAVFLGWYGLKAARRALHPQAMTIDRAAADAPASASAAIAAAAAFSLLNPHVYLDTVVLLGSIGAQQPPGLRPCFGLGAAAASFAWFFSLGYGARHLAPLFARPLAWRVLDALIAATMWAIAASLLIERFA